MRGLNVVRVCVCACVRVCIVCGMRVLHGCYLRCVGLFFVLLERESAPRCGALWESTSQPTNLSTSVPRGTLKMHVWFCRPRGQHGV